MKKNKQRKKERKKEEAKVCMYVFFRQWSSLL